MRPLVVCAILLLGFVPSALSEDGEPGAVIRFSEVDRIYVRDHDGDWLAWIAGAPEFVNATFIDRHGTRILAGPPTPTPTPTAPPTATTTPPPTPTPEPTAAAGEARGFTLSGRGSATEPVTATSRLVCSARVKDNIHADWEPAVFSVSVHGTGYRRVSGLIGLHRSPDRRDIGSVKAIEWEFSPRVIHLGEVGQNREHWILPPYTVGVRATGSWMVWCDPVEPLPAAEGFAVFGDAPSPVWGEDVRWLDGDPNGLLDCAVDWWPPSISWRTQGLQWMLWGHDENGDQVQYGYQHRRSVVLRERAEVWLGAERPGEYATFLPPYGYQVFVQGEWVIRCEPAGQDE